ncbi:helix-turn-helix transcriptional regulator [Nocardiopsis nanhaiensis]
MAPSVGIARRTLSRVMREARLAAEVRAGDAAVQVGVSAGTLSKYEKSEHPWPPAVVYALSDMYKLREEDRNKLVDLARQREPGWWQTSTVPSWFAPYLGAESEAAELDNYEDALVPGLCQTFDYASALVSAVTEDDTDRTDGRAAARVHRQKRLTGENPLRFSVVFNESALHRVVGGTEVMREQLVHLLEMMNLPNLDLRCVPFTAGAHVATEGNFVLLRFPDLIEGVRSGDAVYIEYAIGGMFLEQQTETSYYQGLFRKVQEAALDQQETRTLVQQLLDEKYK